MLHTVSDWIAGRCRSMAPEGSLAEWGTDERFYWLPIKLALFLLLFIYIIYLVKDFITRNGKNLNFPRYIKLNHIFSSNLEKILVIGLLVISLGFRLLYITQPIKGDEAFTAVWYASKPLYISQSVYTFPNNHLLNTLLIHFSMKTFGFNEFAVRLPALLFMLGSIIVLYFIVRHHFNKEVALLSASMLSASSVMIEYSVNGRGYSLMIFFSLLAWYALEKAINHLNYKLVFLASIFASLAIYSILTSVIAILGIFIYFLLLNKKDYRPIVKFISLTAIFSLFLYGPVLTVSGISSLFYSGGGKFPFTAIIFSLLSFYFGLLRYFLLGLPPKLFWVFVTLIIGSIVYSVLIRNKKIWALVSSMLLITTLFVIFLREIPYERIFLFLAPLLYLLIALAGYLFFKKIRLGMSVLLSMIILVNGFWTFNKINNEQYFQFWGDTRSAANFLKGMSSSGNCIYLQTNGLQDSLDFYLTPGWMRKHQCDVSTLTSGTKIISVENVKRLDISAKGKISSKKLLINIKDINIYEGIYE